MEEGELPSMLAEPDPGDKTTIQADTVRDRQHSERELQAATGGPLHGPEESQPDTEAGQQQQSHDKAPAPLLKHQQGPSSRNSHPWVH